MNAELVDRIVNAVLYEGYMLYPYRPSALKNQQRFNFGVVYPRAYGEAQGGTDPWTMQTQCLMLGNQATECLVRVRFLRLVERSIGKALAPSSNLPSHASNNFEAVDRLEVNGEIHQAWQEASEEEIAATELNLSALAAQPMQWPFRLSATEQKQPIRDADGSIVGMIRRSKAGVAGALDFSARSLAEGIFQLTVRIANYSGIQRLGPIGREEALARSFISTHTILEARQGEFVSLVDPPEACRCFAQSCQNAGTWPVLVGEESERDTMLSSPIILYDYPQIAPESPGDLFDGAEIDEILSLRIMTLTEEEKQEMRHSDERARRILERTESLPDEQFRKLHGALRGLRAAKAGTP
jgi:hypothetical protein